VFVMVLYAACTVAEGSSPSRTETRTLELKPGGQLRASTFNGSIRVEGWDCQEISLVAEIRERREGDIRFIAESKDGRVEIIAEQEKKRRKYAIAFGFIESPGVSFTLKIPKKAMATLLTSNGRIEISDIEADVDATTSNASITIDRIGGGVSLATKNASIKANSVMGKLLARTTNASIYAMDMQGGVELRTSNGRIDVGNAMGMVDATTTNASVIAKNIGGDLIVKTSNGRIEAKDVKGKAEANTSNGSITAENIDGELTGKTSNGRIDIRKVMGAIDMATTNGSIKAVELDGKGKGIRLATSNASIDVTLGRAQGMLEARTGDSRPSVTIEVPNAQPSQEDFMTRAKIGHSQQLIELRTTFGKITVR
jgi:DUF4097 and DUF4098 domain-containing protein YvlB